MSVNDYVDKLKEKFIEEKIFTKDQIDFMILGFKMGCEFSGKYLSGVICDLLVTPFSAELNSENTEKISNEN